MPQIKKNNAAARDHLARARTLFQTIGDQYGEAMTWHNLASIDLEEGNYTAARGHFARCLTIEQTISDLAGLAATWHKLATIELRTRNYAAARSQFSRALTICRAIGDWHGEGSAFFQLGILALDVGRATDGARLISICLMIDNEIGHDDAPQDLTALLEACEMAGLKVQQEVRALLQETAEEYRRDRGEGLLKRAFPEGWEAGITPSG